MRALQWTKQRLLQANLKWEFQNNCLGQKDKVECNHDQSQEFRQFPPLAVDSKHYKHEHAQKYKNGNPDFPRINLPSKKQ